MVQGLANLASLVNSLDVLQIDMLVLFLHGTQVNDQSIPGPQLIQIRDSNGGNGYVHLRCLFSLPVYFGR